MGGVEFGHANGLPTVSLSHASGATALLYIYAAHLASWKTADGDEQLFMSSKTEYGGGKAMRGGVPICWPQFSDRGPGKRHGIVRASDRWVVTRTATEPVPCVELCYSDAGFKLFYLVSLDGPDSCTTTLTALNTAGEPLDFTGALHTYLRVSSAVGATVRGLQGVSYEDNCEAMGGKLGEQEDAEVLVTGEELDRVYLDTPSAAYVIDGERALRVIKQGFPDAVVWNIGEAKAGGLKDLGEGEWQRYVCLEAAAIGKPVRVAPNSAWVGSQTFTKLKAVDVCLE